MRVLRRLAKWLPSIGVLLASAACDSVPPTVDELTDEPPPGNLRRLTRDEYDRTVADLLGDYSRPARAFPTDEVAFIFENIGQAQTLSRLHLQHYEAAAERLVATAWDRRRATPAPLAYRVLEPVESVDSADFSDGKAWRLGPGTDLPLALSAPEPGACAAHVRAHLEAQPSGPVALRVMADQVVLARADLAAAWPDAMEIDLRFAPAWADDLTTTVALSLDPAGLDPGVRVLVGDAAFRGPVLTDEQRIADCDPATRGAPACARAILEPFARRAWRRPVAPAELDRLLRFLDVATAEGDDFSEGVKLAMRAVLLAPDFLFRLEFAPDPAAAAGTPLDAHALATRLSFLMWGSMPDAALSASADTGHLLDPAELEAQTRRLAADPRFAGFVSGFAGKWLSYENLPLVDPSDPTRRYQPFASWRMETQLLATSIIQGGGDLTALLTADRTFVDALLEQQYMLPPPMPSSPSSYDPFVEVALDGVRRRGVLTQSSFLSQYPRPTLRGKFVLERFLCAAPPPPPDDVANNTFNAVMQNDPDHTLRQILEQHRANPTCATCHAAMDPVGFAFSHYDGAGGWIDMEVGQPVNASGDVKGLGHFDGAMDLIGLVMADKRLSPCIVRHAMTFALGRGDIDATRDGTAAIAAAFDASGHNVVELLVAIAKSRSFRSHLDGSTP